MYWIFIGWSLILIISKYPHTHQHILMHLPVSIIVLSTDK